MANATFSRLGSANTYDNAVRTITARQSKLSALQENLTSGKRVVRASDDPTSAAIAERALTRINRIATDQRALESQRNAITQAESTLGDVSDAMQRFRELVVNAGNGIHTASELRTIAQEMKGLRDQVFSLSNRQDTNGLPLFNALGSALAPFVGPNTTAPEYSFNGLPGQTSNTAVSIPVALDGDSAFMHQPSRDGVFTSTISNTSTGSISGRSFQTGPVTMTDSTVVSATATAAQATGSVPFPTYTVEFTNIDTTTTPGVTNATYRVTETPAVNPIGAPAPFGNVTVSYPTGQSANFNVTAIPGLSFSITGTPAVNDRVTVDASSSVFSDMDYAISHIGNAINSNEAVQTVTQALHNIDISMERVSAVRGQAGELLNRADRISGNQDKRSIQMEADRSRAEDIDMVKGISDFQTQQTGYQAALQTYAQIQKLSLFNFIGG
ncbi:hypothetical protein MIZ03_3826 [Rhodoferax lithotrophicus]|uniref:Flagellar hook-associated protein 3 n=1 Tax=Rhodoferax lithotrophicus TaxID=2798804 RepID=A0ABM7MRC2_9BURK|nr:flagellar hook-associated protein FlgL [Rhodoferax sp. MIZ03]BCO28916.1 hypothetical protein MIZ03_3826 [Rhodoferax sp. MIZ03]